MTNRNQIRESAMVAPVRALFPEPKYRHFEQVALGRKKIDLICLRLKKPCTIAIELKVTDWKTALWQAIVNLQVSDKSYIGIWHAFAHRAVKQTERFKSYGIGLIEVTADSARLVLESADPIQRIAKSRKRQWYQHLLSNA